MNADGTYGVGWTEEERQSIEFSAVADYFNWCFPISSLSAAKQAIRTCSDNEQEHFVLLYYYWAFCTHLVLAFFFLFFILIM